MFIHNLVRRFGVAALFAGICVTVLGPQARHATAANSESSDERIVSGPVVAVVGAENCPHGAALREGVLEGLRRGGYMLGKNVRLQVHDAADNVGQLPDMLSQIVRDRPRVIVALGTAAARAAAAATREIPVVYGAVSDPAGAGLSNASDAAPGNVTGVSDTLALERQVELIRAVLPQARRVGLVYDPQNPDATATAKQLQSVLTKAGMTLVEALASRASDVGPAARSLIERADVFFSSGDPTVRAGYPALVRVAEESRIPLLAGQADAVARGAVAIVELSYREIGAQAGVMAARVLKGESPGQIKPQGARRLALHINTQAAARQGVTLPESVLKSAAQVIRP